MLRLICHIEANIEGILSTIPSFRPTVHQQLLQLLHLHLGSPPGGVLWLRDLPRWLILRGVCRALWYRSLLRARHELHLDTLVRQIRVRNLQGMYHWRHCSLVRNGFAALLATL